MLDPGLGCKERILSKENTIPASQEPHGLVRKANKDYRADRLDLKGTGTCTVSSGETSLIYKSQRRFCRTCGV